MDIKKLAAMQLAEEYHCKVLETRCPDCDSPLVMFPYQDVAFCIVEIAKNEKAQQDQHLLEMLKFLEEKSKPTVDTKIIILGPNPQGSIHWKEYLRRKAS